VNLGDGPRAYSLLLSAHDQKMADFLELQGTGWDRIAGHFLLGSILVS
jgi:hypothetical protein